MDLYKLFDIYYLFQPQPSVGFSWPLRLLLLAFFIASIVLAIIADNRRQTAQNLYKKAWRKWQIWGWFNGLIGLTLVTFREVEAIYLSSRIWLLLWILIALIWLGTIIYYWKKSIPSKQESQAQEEAFNKWLPKKK